MSNLKTRREIAGLSQSQLAKKSGVNLRMIQGYEQGYKNINDAKVMTVYKLAEALKCEISDLMEIKE